MREADRFVDRTREQQVATSFSGWFAFGDTPHKVPPNWKQTMIVLLTLYPVVMLELLFLNPLTQPLGMAVATFIGNALSVAATGFILIPLAIRALNWWLVSGPDDSPRVQAAGIALVIGGYVVSIAVFYGIVSLIGT